MAGCVALVRVRIPDRPGALGLVASRVGALKGDIVGIEILDRRDGVALDELAVLLPDADLVPAVTREIDEVDGAVTESVRIVEVLPEPRLDAVRTAIACCRARTSTALSQALADETARAVRADWCAVLDARGAVATTEGCPQNIAESATTTVPIGDRGATLAIGSSHALGAGEVELITAWCELVDMVWV